MGFELTAALVSEVRRLLKPLSWPLRLKRFHVYTVLKHKLVCWMMTSWSGFIVLVSAQISKLRISALKKWMVVLVIVYLYQEVDLSWNLYLPKYHQVHPWIYLISVVSNVLRVNLALPANNYSVCVWVCVLFDKCCITVSHTFLDFCPVKNGSVCKVTNKLFPRRWIQTP